MEHVVIHDPDAGPVHVWRSGWQEASASTVGAFFSSTEGRLSRIAVTLCVYESGSTVCGTVYPQCNPCLARAALGGG